MRKCLLITLIQGKALNVKFLQVPTDTPQQFLLLMRAHRYLPLIEKILKKNNIPDDFKYLVAAESEYSNMVSPAGATGFWQIMPETGKEEGMEINTVVDERYDVEKSTQFACDYFLKSYEKYGNWTLAAASYDGGRGCNR